MGDQQKRMVKEDVWHLDTRYKRGRIGVKSQLPRGTSWIYVFFSWNKHLFVLKTHCLTSNVWPLILSVLSESDSEITGRIRKVVSNFKGCPTNCISLSVLEAGSLRWRRLVSTGDGVPFLCAGSSYPGVILHICVRASVIRVILSRVPHSWWPTSSSGKPQLQPFSSFFFSS